jgi:hypothetical protein
MTVMQAALPGYIGFVHGVKLNGKQLFFLQPSLQGGPGPVRRRRYLRKLHEQSSNCRSDVKVPIRKEAGLVLCIVSKRRLRPLLSSFQLYHLREIDSTISKIKVEGDRLPKAALKMTKRKQVPAPAGQGAE